jgi:diguanylate cyclase (GGDEF)-like protein
MKGGDLTMQSKENREVENLRKLVAVLKRALIQKDCELQFAISQLRELEQENEVLEKSREPDEEFDSFHLYLMDCCESLNRENDALRPRLYLDELSGAYNVRYFVNRIEEEIQRAVRHKRELSVIVLGIEDFRNIHRTFGIDIGNHILIESFKCIRDSLRNIDIVARIKDNEFGIILPETSQENALLVEERISRRIESFSLVLSDTISSLKIKSSTRVICFNDFTRSSSELMKEALNLAFDGRRERGVQGKLQEGISGMANVNN